MAQTSTKMQRKLHTCAVGGLPSAMVVQERGPSSFSSQLNKRVFSKCGFCKLRLRSSSSLLAIVVAVFVLVSVSRQRELVRVLVQPEYT